RLKADAALHEIPIIVVTSYALAGDDNKARAAGCDATSPNPTARVSSWRRSVNTCLRPRRRGDGMRRREVIVLIGGAAAWPLVAGTQQATMPVIGYVGTGSPESDAFRLPSFQRGLEEAGYVEGRNVTIEYRWAEGHNDRLPALMADLVSRRVAVIAVPA